MTDQNTSKRDDELLRDRYWERKKGQFADYAEQNRKRGDMYGKSVENGWGIERVGRNW